MRKSTELSRSVDQVAEAHRQLIMARSARQIPSVQDMSIINAKAGEVFIFNNKNYHAIEPWRLSSKRLNYIVRTLPLYDFALQPPQHFLGTAKCNRYIFNQAKNCLEPFDVNASVYGVDFTWLASGQHAQESIASPAAMRAESLNGSTLHQIPL